MMAVTGPAELSAAATLIDFWKPNVSPAVWYTIFILPIIIINFCGVRIYGEVSFDSIHATFEMTLVNVHLLSPRSFSQ